jgi:hypothetical protein
MKRDVVYKSDPHQTSIIRVNQSNPCHPCSNVIKLSRSLSEVEAIFPASASLSQRFIFPRDA